MGILVPSDRPVLELLHVRLLIKYPVSLALPKAHPHANKPEIPLSLLKEEPFIGLNRMHPNYGDWLLKACRRAGFKPRIAKEADGAASALAFVAGSWWRWSAAPQKIPRMWFRNRRPRTERCRPEAGSISTQWFKFVDVLAGFRRRSGDPPQQQSFKLMSPNP